VSAELETLARRAVACKHWRWMPGMRWSTQDDAARLDDYQPEYMGRPSDALPDLTDPATLGCLLALVREAWGDPCMYLAPADGWYVGKGGRDSMPGEGPTEASALVAALEAAP
jgi:hypothetical protein